ncbi:MAG TPA: hypothetical protein VL688_12285 [Verrucomicrobiae bacterium]|nr:hypothetical protein [Verrucomicrobiae bacterium]
MNRTFYHAIALASAGAGVCLAAASLLHPAFAHAAFNRLSFYILALVVAAWASALKECADAHPPDWRAFLREYGPGLAFCLTAAAFIFISVRPYFRILDDETCLLSVSKSMLAERSVANITQGKWLFYNLSEGDFNEPKRPFLFPFLTYLLHVLFGYRTVNPFVLNFLSLAGLFFTAFHLLKRNAGSAAGVAGVLLIAAQPVVIQAATCAGFDLFTAFLVFAGMALVDAYFLKPSPAKLSLVWMHLILLSHARYEGVLYLAVAAVLLFWMGALRFRSWNDSLVYALTPLMLLPVLLQRLYVETDLQNPAGVKPFSFAHFLHHNADFLKSLGRFDFALPYATPVNILGVVSGIILTTAFFEKRWPAAPARRSAVVVSAAMFGAYWTVMNAHFGEFLRLEDGSRVMALMAIVLAFLAALLLGRLAVFRQRPALLVALSLSVFILYHRFSVENRFQNALNRPREYRIVMDFLGKQFPQSMMVVSNMPQLYPVQNYGAVNFDTANNNRAAFLKELKDGLYHHIFVIQEIDYATGQAIHDTALDPGYPLEPVYETQREPGILLRISKVVAP